VTEHLESAGDRAEGKVRSRPFDIKMLPLAREKKKRKAKWLELTKGDRKKKFLQHESKLAMIGVGGRGAGGLFKEQSRLAKFCLRESQAGVNRSDHPRGL